MACVILKLPLQDGITLILKSRNWGSIRRYYPGLIYSIPGAKAFLKEWLQEKAGLRTATKSKIVKVLWGNLKKQSLRWVGECKNGIMDCLQQWSSQNFVMDYKGQKES